MDGVLTLLILMVAVEVFLVIAIVLQRKGIIE